MPETFAFLFSEDGNEFGQHSTGLTEADALAQAARVLRKEPENSFLEATTDGGFRVMTTYDRREWIWKRES